MVIHVFCQIYYCAQPIRDYRCIAAYSMVVNPESCVKLSCVRMGVEDTLGFAIHAVMPIKSQQVIYELVGLKPGDGKAENSQVLDIKPSPNPNQSTDVKRLLFGPIRFINHICSMPNAEVSLLCFFSPVRGADPKPVRDGRRDLWVLCNGSPGYRPWRGTPHQPWRRLACRQTRRLSMSGVQTRTETK
jgi:hypothetical protein